MYDSKTKRIIIESSFILTFNIFNINKPLSTITWWHYNYFPAKTPFVDPPEFCSVDWCGNQQTMYYIVKYFLFVLTYDKLFFLCALRLTYTRCNIVLAKEVLQPVLKYSIRPWIGLKDLKEISWINYAQSKIICRLVF